MPIRPFRSTDVDALVDIWLKGSLSAHDFIDPNYWIAKLNDMKSMYLPFSKTYVIEQGTNLLGFVSMMDDYLAALFVDPNQQNKGYGKQLLDYIKENHDTAELKVYQRNQNAIRFYLKNGFAIVREDFDQATSEKDIEQQFLFTHNKNLFLSGR